MDFGTQHHVRDVGRILLDLQNELRGLRSNLKEINDENASNETDTTDGESMATRMDSLLAKAEVELRAKAEVVLSSAISTNARTLPLIHSPQKQQHQAPIQGVFNSNLSPRKQRPNEARRQPKAIRNEILVKREQALVADPTRPGAREYLAARLGVPLSDVGKNSKGLKTQLPPELLTQQGMGHIFNTGGMLLHNRSEQQQQQLQQQQQQQASHKRRPNSRIRGGQDKTRVSATTTARYQLDVDTKNSTDIPQQLLDAEKNNDSFNFRKQQTHPNMAQIDQPPVLKSPQKGPQRNNADLHEAVDRIRDYNELLDTYSLHQFIIRRGRTLVETPEFQSFKRKHSHLWGPISGAIVELEKLFTLFDIPVAYVDGQKLVKLALDELAQRGTKELMTCITNFERVSNLIETPGRLYAVGQLKHDSTSAAASQNHTGHDEEPLMSHQQLRPPGSPLTGVRQGEHIPYLDVPTAAVTRIQALWRCYDQYRHFGEKKERAKAAYSIQYLWRGHKARRDTRIRVTQLRKTNLEQFEAIQNDFARSWPRIKNQRRVVVHIPSMSLEEDVRIDVPLLSVLQNTQLARLCEVADDQVDVVYVSPYPLNDQVISYYHKVLMLGGVENPATRLKIVVPENASRLPPHFSLSTLLYYSPRAMRRIQRLVQGQLAYICPGAVGEDDRQVALQLGLPLLSPAPEVAALYRSRSGAKVLFLEAGVSTGPGLRDVYEYDELIVGLAKQIINNLDTNVWLLKVDDEFSGRGDAHLDAGSMLSVTELRSERNIRCETTPQYWSRPDVLAKAQNHIAAVLHRELPRRLHVPTSNAFSTFTHYMHSFLRVGGVVEAVPNDICGRPSANFFIAPDGEITVTSTHEQLYEVGGHRRIGCAFPQRSVPHYAISAAAQAIGQTLRLKHVFGHCTVHFSVFTYRRPGTESVEVSATSSSSSDAVSGGDGGSDDQLQLRMWASEVELGLQGSDASFALFHFLMDGVLDRDSGQYILRREASSEPDQVSESIPSQVLNPGCVPGQVSNNKKEKVESTSENSGETKESVNGLNDNVDVGGSDIPERSESGDAAGNGYISDRGNDPEISGSGDGLAERSLVSEVGSLIDHVEDDNKQRREEEKERARMPRRHDDEDKQKIGSATKKEETRSYVFIDVLHHPNLASQQYRTFFSACRRQGIAFDLEARSGLAFLLIDSLASGVIGALAVGQSYHHALDSIFGCLRFVLEQAGAAPRVRDDSTDIGVVRMFERVKQLRAAETARIQSAIKTERLKHYAERRKKRNTGVNLPQE